MLSQLHIKDFTLVQQLDLELHGGLSTITGETGAGKSILLGALGLTLGDKTDADKVRPGSDKLEIHASFDLSALTYVQGWLKTQELLSDSDEQECILRRVITKEGRSRAYINGQIVPLSQLRQLGELLIDIHSQHAHQSLLLESTHRRLLDEYASATALAKTVKQAYKNLHTIDEKLQQASAQSDESNARFQLLQYQVNELDLLDLQEGELQKLEQEQQLLTNMASNLHNCQHAATLCSTDDQGIIDKVNNALNLISQINPVPEQLANVGELLESARIHVQEAKSDLDYYLDGNEQDPARLNEVEQRLSQIYDIAQKHRVSAPNLLELHLSLAQELKGLSSGDELIAQLQAEKKQALSSYQEHAQKLSKKRNKGANTLMPKVNKKLSGLAMERASFEIALTPLTTNDNAGAHGNERVEFLISTMPGQAAKALHKIASGGELSRISLAIQVITAATSGIPTLVFDEVDVGIGGTTGDVVGKMLSELGDRGQVLCVTHLAQVASKAHQHLLVEKQVSKKGANSSLRELKGEEKIAEIARMMGGDVGSTQSLAHAKQMLEMSKA
ncbi:MAG: DNA repair protein RecN [Alteromonadaceae bacterium]|nr:MAG: DNA repair protein RecN [Alteromonadaceae bacterium]